MKKIDKIRALRFVALEQNQDGRVVGLVQYDVKKLRRVQDDALKELLIEKTLRLYPFAIIGGEMSRFRAWGRAELLVCLPLSPSLRVSPVKTND